MKIFLLLVSICVLVISLTFFSSCYQEDCCNPPPQGKGDLKSSFARHNDYLYALDNNNYLMAIYQKAANGTFSLKKTLDLDSRGSSIFIRDTRLIIRSLGLYIYDISDPEAPALLYSDRSLPSCSLVEFSDHFLFSSVNSTNGCFSSTHDVIEIRDINEASTATPVAVIQATHSSLSIDGNILFLGSMESGLIVFDISDITNIVTIKTYEEIKGTEVIADSNVLIVTTPGGVDQYDYSNLNSIQLLSHINFLQ